jgi:poly(3-hydroxybutyrate) depolymerase
MSVNTANSLMKQAFPLLLLLFIFSSCAKTASKNPSKTDTVQLSNLSDITYGSNKDTSGNMIALNLDLYFPAYATSASHFPLVVMMHGGSYLNGDKTDVSAYCSVLADSGFVVAAINYRLGWRAGADNCSGDTSSQLLAGYRALQDGNASLRFLISNANKFGIDPDWVFVGGNSAGSSLALNTAYIPNYIAQTYLPSAYAQLGPINSAGNSLTNSFKIRGICNMWGALTDSTLINAFNALPTISFHGTTDPVVPYDIGFDNSCPNYLRLYGSACIHRRLVYYNVPVISNFAIGAGHEPDVYTAGFLMSNTACFFHKLIHGTPISSQLYTSLVSSCN